MACSGGGGAPPVTLAKFTLNGAGGLDFYEVSLAQGYNLPMMVVPQSGNGGNCSSTGCAADLNEDCPVELKIIDGSNEGVPVVACKSACDAFRDAQNCCRGAYASPDTCKPSIYTEFFRNACPQAYSYAYDDGTSTFTCIGADYVITFCPGLPTRLNWVAKAATPVPKDAAAKTKPCSTALTTASSNVVHVLTRNPRRLQGGKLPEVNFYAPPSTSDEESENLSKLPPTPPAPIGNTPPHQH
ncbi:hypothetical protein SLEP1_g58303 [Rubroshorea leprosula]|uniref:Thaumatin-like protein n=1 Tax=Rubroshorea leprosula TaxID=152421 RepID=A0AAV5MSH9_9ROSI|nr:hypothetical protein SLEP1_g58303 [Rubroshorea leprosula]